MSTGRHLSSGFLLLATAFVGCTVGPNYRPPEVQLPAAFCSATDIVPTTQPATRPATAASVVAVHPVDLTRWWEALGDDELNSLVRRAVAANPDLRIAAARLQEAREVEYGVTGGVVPGLGYFPGADVAAAAGRGSGNNSTKGRITAPLNAAANTKNFTEITQIIGFDAGWELDLFGRFRRIIEAAQADVQAEAELRNEMIVSVVADVVRSYIAVRSYQYRLEVARQNVLTQRRTLDLVRLRVRGLVGNDLDLALAERQLSSTLSRIAPLEAQLGAAKRRVAVLVGEYPEALSAELERPLDLPATPPQVSAGMPVELLRRRPDIRRAERQVAAATARIGVATADLFPRINVTAGAGIQGQGLGRDPEKARYIYSIGPSFYWPLLDFGRLDSVIQAQDYRTQQALLIYQRAVVTAVQEVDDALNNYAAEQDRLSQLGQAVASSKRAERLATQRYDNGLTDFLNVLDAQRQLFDLQDQYAVAQESLVTQFVALYKALGGGWEGYEAPPPPPPPKPALLAAIDQGSPRKAAAEGRSAP
jgi:NodT family efflux transporter outer membrane factor (OMF) lipoprotein